MNILSIQSNIDKFFDEHGKYVTTGANGSWFLFEDGAMYENVPSLMGWMKEPPEDPLERWTLIAQYREIRLANSVDEFDREHRRLDKDNYAWRDAEKNFLRLEKLKEKVKKQKRSLATATRKRNRLDPKWISPEEHLKHAKERDRNEGRKASFKNKLKKFQV